MIPFIGWIWEYKPHYFITGIDWDKAGIQANLLVC